MSHLSRLSSSCSKCGKYRPSGVVPLPLAQESSTASCAGSKGRKNFLIQLAMPEKPFTAPWRLPEPDGSGKASREEQAKQSPVKHKQSKKRNLGSPQSCSLRFSLSPEWTKEEARRCSFCTLTAPVRRCSRQVWAYSPAPLSLSCTPGDAFH